MVLVHTLSKFIAATQIELSTSMTLVRSMLKILHSLARILIHTSSEFYQHAASQGQSDAQFNLGLLYTHGHGVEKNDAKAVEYYQQADDRGYDLDGQLCCNISQPCHNPDPHLVQVHTNDPT
mmetsp:Transcript_19710/g.54268  ORF Transcript_19710/g.54268 Transcript_19710/m.54268 type:complete len:122 (-) Transcript_19710:428-793(-)